MRNFVFLAFGLLVAFSSQSLALTISNSDRDIDVRLFTTDRDNPILFDGDGEAVTDNNPHLQNLFATIGSSGTGVIPSFEARAGMTSSGVFGLEATINPFNFPTDAFGDPIFHTIEANVRLSILMDNLTSDVFKLDSSFFVSGGEFSLGPADVDNFVDYRLRTFVGPSVIPAGGTTIPIEEFASTAIYEGFNFDPVSNTFTETGTSLGGVVDPDQGTVTFPFSAHVASDREILPGEQIALFYDLSIRIRTNGNSEGPISFFFNDPLGANGLPDPNGGPLLPSLEFDPSDTQSVPAPPMAPIVAGAMLFLAAIRRRRMKGN